MKINRYTIIHAVGTGRLGSYVTQAHRVECAPIDLKRYLSVLDPWFVFEGWPDFEGGFEGCPPMLDKKWCEQELRAEQLRTKKAAQ